MRWNWFSSRAAATPSDFARMLQDSSGPLGALGLDGPELARMIEAETDPDVLRNAMGRADRSGDDRWGIATRARLSLIARDPAIQAELVQSLCRTRQGKRAEGVLAQIDQKHLDPGRFAQLCASVAIACGRFEDVADFLPAIHPNARVYVMVEMANARLSRGDFQHGLDAARSVLDERPDFGQAAVLAVRAAMLLGGRIAARAEIEALATTFRLDPDAAIEAEILILLNLGRTPEAAEIFFEALSENSLRTQLYPYLVSFLHWELSADRALALLDNVPSTPDSVAFTLNCKLVRHANRGEFDAAQQMLDLIKPLSDWTYRIARLQLACQTKDLSEVLSGLVEAREAEVWHGGQEFLVFPFLTMMCPDHPAFPEAHDRYAALEIWEFGSSGYWLHRLRMLIAFDKDDEARALIERLPKGMLEYHEIFAIDLYLKRNTMQAAQHRAEWRRLVQESAAFAVTARTAMPRTLNLTWAGGTGDVLLFAVMQNGLEYLPWLFDYYRNLGVDHFFIVDNGSTDGGREWLLARAADIGDVSVFAQDDSFREAAHGVAWTNHLLQRFGVGHWCFHVDMDEAFVFAGMDEGRTLRDLLAYLDETGAESLGGFMLDIYPPTLSAPQGEDLFASSTLIDRGYTFMPYPMPPYSFALGGVRARMTRQQLLMTKAPLVRMRHDLHYLLNNHFHSGAQMSDVTCALLHYKFVGDLRKRVKDQVAREEHFMGGRFYKTLQPYLQPDVTLHSEESVTYEGPSQLVGMGYLTYPARWKGWRTKS